jgi:hypothetical protein
VVRSSPAAPSPFDESAALPIWQGRHQRPDWPTPPDDRAEIEAAYPASLGVGSVTFGPYRRTYAAGTVFYTSDFVAARVVQQNLGRRPVAWSVTTGRNFLSLDPYLVQKGLVFELQPTEPDSLAPGIDRQRLAGALLDVPTTDRLVWETYRYGWPAERRLARPGGHQPLVSPRPWRSRRLSWLTPTRRSVMTDDGQELRTGPELSPNPALASALSQVRLDRCSRPPIPLIVPAIPGQLVVFSRL